MGIETLRWYHPLYNSPVYIKLGFPQHNDYKVGESYDMRVADSEKSGGEAYSYPHKAILVGKEEYVAEDLPDLLVAVLANTRSKGDALQMLNPTDKPLPPDREVLLLTYLREDKAKELVTSDIEIIPDDNRKENHYD